MVSEVNGDLHVKINFEESMEQQLEELQLHALTKGWNERQLYAATLLALPRHTREMLKPPIINENGVENYNQTLSLLNNNIRNYASGLKSSEKYFDEFTTTSIKLGESV